MNKRKIKESFIKNYGIVLYIVHGFGDNKEDMCHGKVANFTINHFEIYSGGTKCLVQ
jgi:hypothetical protein